nr:hypothetical protein [Tanacetum cinerariifolium]
GKSSADALGHKQGVPKLNARTLLLHFDHSKAKNPFEVCFLLIRVNGGKPMRL